jgi:tetratricopeptide (TPR) repeat protein
MIRWLLVLTLCWGSARAQTVLAAANEATEADLGGLSATDKQIQVLQERVRRVPSDYAAYNELGASFLQKARESGDIAFYDLADQALKKSVALAPQDFRAAGPLVHIGLVCMGEHRFSDALSYAQSALALGSGDLAALALEGDAYTDIGDYDDAKASYDGLRALGQATSSSLSLAYVLDSRLAYLSFLHGDTAEAIRLMNNAITAALQKQEPRENLAWLYFELGERYFQGGDLQRAHESYRAGSSADPNHYRSIAGLAKVAAAQGKWEDAILLYRRSIAIIPFPPYVAELGDIYRKTGRSKEAQEQYDLVEYIGHLSKLNRVLANRELALFYADRGMKLREALDLAERELQVRHDIYSWDALAWVLYKNERTEEAAKAIKNALRLNTNDSVLLFHAGMIYLRQGNDTDARQFLSLALQTNPHFSVFDADEATQKLAEIAQRHHEVRSSNGVN